MAKGSMEWDRKDILELKRVIIEEVEAVIFSTRRSSKKKKGGYEIENESGKLRRSIRKNLTRTNFIKQDKKGNLEITLNLVEYYKYLDEGTSKMPGWFTTDKIFDNDRIREKLRELQLKTTKRAILDVISEMNK